MNQERLTRVIIAPIISEKATPTEDPNGTSASA